MTIEILKRDPATMTDNELRAAMLHLDAEYDECDCHERCMEIEADMDAIEAERQLRVKHMQASLRRHGIIK